HRDDVARVDLVECLDSFIDLQVKRPALWPAYCHYAVVAVYLFNHCIDFPGMDDRATWRGAFRCELYALALAGSGGAGAFAQRQHDRLEIFHLEACTWLHLIEVLRFGWHIERCDAALWAHDGDHAR